MSVIIKEEINDLVKVKGEIEDKKFLSLQQSSQDNCQSGEKLLPFEFVKLEPIEEEHKFVKEEYEEMLDLNEQNFYSYVEQKNEDKSSYVESSSPSKVLLPFECKQVVSFEQNKKNFADKKLETENSRNQIIIGTKNQRFYSLLCPGRLKNSTRNYNSEQSSNDSEVALRKPTKKAQTPMSQIQISLWETAQILVKREQDRKRKALRRARETEEERNVRRQKERLARAARRARETLEKRLIRRERDRKAKALSRAKGNQRKTKEETC